MKDHQKFIKGGIAFQVECAVGWQGACGKKNSTTGFFEPVNVRFANRVPLLFNWSADIVYNVMKEIRIQSYIKIEIKQMEQDKKDYFKLIVSDNGTGIPEKNLETIFSKFLQGSKIQTNSLNLIHQKEKPNHVQKDQEDDISILLVALAFLSMLYILFFLHLDF